MAWLCKRNDDTIEVSIGQANLGKYALIKKPYCEICSTPEVQYSSCKRKHYLDGFDKVYTIGIYYQKSLNKNDLLSNHIIELKTDPSYAIPLGLSMSIVAREIFPEILKFDGLVPIPLHPLELAKREFNQSIELAKVVSKQIGLPIVDELTKTREQTLRGLSFKARLEAVSGLYRVHNFTNIQGKDLIIIDDVLAAGATSSECAKMLKSANANSVSVLVAGRTMYAKAS